MFTYVYVLLHILCVFLYIFLDFVHIQLIANKRGGAGGAPPPISLSILYENNPKIYTKTHKNMKIHITIYKKYKKVYK